MVSDFLNILIELDTPHRQNLANKLWPRHSSLAARLTSGSLHNADILVRDLPLVYACMEPEVVTVSAASDQRVRAIKAAALWGAQHSPPDAEADAGAAMSTGAGTDLDIDDSDIQRWIAGSYNSRIQQAPVREFLNIAELAFSIHGPSTSLADRVGAKCLKWFHSISYEHRGNIGTWWSDRLIYATLWQGVLDGRWGTCDPGLVKGFSGFWDLPIIRSWFREFPPLNLNATVALLRGLAVDAVIAVGMERDACTSLLSMATKKDPSLAGVMTAAAAALASAGHDVPEYCLLQDAEVTVAELAALTSHQREVVCESVLAGKVSCRVHTVRDWEMFHLWVGNDKRSIEVVANVLVMALWLSARSASDVQWAVENSRFEEQGWFSVIYYLDNDSIDKVADAAAHFLPGVLARALAPTLNTHTKRYVARLWKNPYRQTRWAVVGGGRVHARSGSALWEA